MAILPPTSQAKEVGPLKRNKIQGLPMTLLICLPGLVYFLKSSLGDNFALGKFSNYTLISIENY